jgi:hypothetical protein
MVAPWLDEIYKPLDFSQINGYPHNKKFNQITQKLHQDIKPPEAAIFIYYLESFDRELDFQIREEDPQNLRAAQESAIKIEKNMTASKKSNQPSASRSHTRNETRSRAVNTADLLLIA